MILSHHTKQCYQRHPCASMTRCLHSETCCRMRHILKLGNLRAVERLAGKFGLVFPPPPPPKDISLFKGNEGGSQGHFVSHLPGRRMPRCNRFCHCPSGTLGYKQLLALGWGCARRQGVRHQLLYRQSRVQGCQRTSQLLISPLSSITTILLKKKTALLLPSQV